MPLHTHSDMAQGYIKNDVGSKGKVSPKWDVVLKSVHTFLSELNLQAKMFENT